MIVQEHKAGNSTIRVEQAESLEDAKKNNFPTGIFSRYLVDGKSVTYTAMVHYIISKSKENAKTLAMTKEEVEKKQRQAIENQKKGLKESFNLLKKEYEKNNAPKEVLDQIDNHVDLMISKLDVNKLNNEGVRIAK